MRQQILRMHRRAAFTLVELLVVIGILIVLLSILLPVLAHVRKEGQRTACMANLRQLGQAYTSYLTGNDGRGIGYARHANGVWIQTFRSDYGNADRVRSCPSAPEISPDFGSAALSWTFDLDLPDLTLDRRVGGYGFNAWLCRWDATGRGGEQYSGGTPAQYFTTFPAESASVPVFGDCTWADAWPRETDQTPPNLIDGARATQGTPPAENMMARFTISRHGRNINVVFLDGHGETVPLENLKQLKWHNGYVPAVWAPPLPAR